MYIFKVEDSVRTGSGQGDDRWKERVKVKPHTLFTSVIAKPHVLRCDRRAVYAARGLYADLTMYRAAVSLRFRILSAMQPAPMSFLEQAASASSVVSLKRWSYSFLSIVSMILCDNGENMFGIIAPKLARNDVRRGVQDV